MNKKLYMVANRGCDATTHGMLDLNDAAYNWLNYIFKSINKNSSHNCMPTIDFCEFEEISEDEHEWYDTCEYDGKFYREIWE